MKKILLFIVVTLIANIINAQQSLDQLILQSTHVSEVEVTQQESKWNENRTRIYTENKLVVKSVFKGESVFFIKTIGGIVGDEFQFQTHTNQIKIGDKGYLFLKDENSSEIAADFILLKHEQNNTSGIKFNRTTFNRDVVRNKLEKLKDESQIESTATNPCNGGGSLVGQNQTQKTISFEFDNIHFTQNFTTIEFDVLARASEEGLYFGRGDIYLSYNEAFGIRNVENEKVSISKSVIINDASYDLTFVDHNDSTVRVSIDNVSNSSFHPLGTLPEKLFHVEVEITNFDILGDLSFDDFTISEDIFYYCNGNYVPFDNINLDNPINGTSAQQGSEIGIIYTFENGSAIENNSKYQVDIFAEATAYSEFVGGQIEIQYDPTAFGGDVVGNGSASFDKGELIDNESIYEFFIFDDVLMTDNILRIFVYSETDSGHEILDETPKKVGTITIDIEDCMADKGLVFDPFTIQTNHLHYTGNPVIPNEEYYPIDIDDTDLGHVCCPAPKITMFSPASIPAGTGDILTITGTNLGDGSLGTGHLLEFFNQEVIGDNKYMSAGPLDWFIDGVSKWTDTEIKVKVPSVETGINYPATSGKFKVSTPCGSDESDDKLYIPYSALAVRDGGRQAPLALPNLDGENICLKFTDDVSLTIRQKFRSELNNWCSKTQIGVLIDPDELVVGDNYTVGADGNNVVHIQELGDVGIANPDAKAALVLTGRFDENCDQDNFTRAQIVSDIDIIISPDALSSSDNAIRHYLRHELGHLHMLGHASSIATMPEDRSIMHSVFGDVSSTSTTNIDIKADDELGAKTVFSRTSAILTWCDNNYSPISTNPMCGDDCLATSTEELIGDSDHISIVPNPNNGRFTLSIDDNNMAMLKKVTVYSTLGETIYSENIKFKSSIDIQLDLDTGIYLVKFDFAEHSITKKIIIE
jgi:hypothetical protein